MSPNNPYSNKGKGGIGSAKGSSSVEIESPTIPL
jgi:hypothetical protein